MHHLNSHDLFTLIFTVTLVGLVIYGLIIYPILDMRAMKKLSTQGQVIHQTCVYQDLLTLRKGNPTNSDRMAEQLWDNILKDLGAVLNGQPRPSARKYS